MSAYDDPNDWLPLSSAPPEPIGWPDTMTPSIAQIKDDTAAIKADIAIIKADLKTTNGRFDDLIERLELCKEIEELKRQMKAKRAS